MTTTKKNPNGVRSSDLPGAVICLCVRPELAPQQAECQRCHRPLLEQMSIDYNKAMTLLAMHETLVPPYQLDGVTARYKAERPR